MTTDAGTLLQEPSALGTSPILKPKSHYEILDGLRGVAAILVVIFHIFEPYNGENRFRQIINHGYLAVDFFFLLSGFVVAYAYDDRWGKMTQWEFYKRRLVRLQPMVVMGTLIGAAMFYTQISPQFPRIATTPVWKMLLIMLIGFTLIPVTRSMDIRGWGEMHPLDGPAWSLFFEYLANIAYAAGVRKLSRKALTVLVFLSGCFLVHYLLFVPRGDVIGGWSLNSRQLHVGFARLLYPFFAGVLLMRIHKRIHVKHSFALCSLLLLVSFSIPRIGGAAHLWANGLYEAFCIIVLFPVIVAMGAGDHIAGGPMLKVCTFLGALSYPLYITHYAFIYLYYGYVTGHNTPAREGALLGVLLFAVALTVAYGCLKLYDEPVRAWLARRFLMKSANSNLPR